MGNRSHSDNHYLFAIRWVSGEDGDDELTMHGWMFGVTVVTSGFMFNPFIGFVKPIAEARKKYGSDDNLLGELIVVMIGTLLVIIPCYIVFAFIPYKTWVLMVNIKEFITGMF